ncbi:MAG TPA: hypothetical protein VLC92_00340 [Rhodocyclaceae bacterium]|nr:hypothetical protein [Rhodocyclaceae bacterium]
MNTINSIQSSINALKGRVAEAQVLADQFAAMKAAADYVTVKAPAELAHLEARLASAQEAEQMAADTLARYTVTRVETHEGGSLLASRTVHFIERCADMDGRPSTREGAMALVGLTPELWAAVVANPRVLPADIRALHGDADSALRIWIGHRLRGYVRS